MRRLFRDRAFLAELAGALGFTTWLAWPFLRTDRWIVGFDTVAYTGPNYAFTRRIWSHWRVPFWNDEIFGGVPHLANPQTAVLYPLKLLTFGLDTNRAIGLLIGLHLLLLSAGMVVLVNRRMALLAPAAFVAAVAVVGSGAVMTKSVQFEQIMVVAWAPWLLVGIDRVLATGSRRSMAGLGVITALALTSGHPQIVYLLVPLVIGWCVVRVWGPRWWGRLGAVAVSGSLGTLVALPQLLPALMATPLSVFAGGRSLALLRNPAYSVDPRSFPASLLGDVTTKNPAFTARSFEGVAFFGTSIVFLGLLAVVLAARRRADRGVVVTLALVGGVSGWLALGPRAGLYRIGYSVIPGFDQARVPARWVVVSAFAVALLAAIAIDAARRSSIGRADVAIAAGAFGVLLAIGLVAVRVVKSMDRPAGAAVGWWVAIAFGLTVLTLVVTIDSSAGDSAFRVVAVGAVTLIVVAELAVLSMHSFGRQLVRRTSITASVSPVVTFLRANPGLSLAITDDRLGDPEYLMGTLRPNTNALGGVRSIDGYDGGVQVTKRWASAVSMLTSGPIDPDLTLRSQMPTPLDAELLARLGVRWVVIETASRSLGATAPGWPPPALVDGTVVVVQNPAYIGQATLRYRSSPVGSSLDAASRLRRGGPVTVPNDLALVEGGRAALACPVECAEQTARVTGRSSGGVDVVADARYPAVLAVDEQSYPRWQVTVDGRSAHPVTVDGLLLGVEIPFGRHVVRFRYHERGFRGALTGAVVGLLGLAVLALRPGRRSASGSGGGWARRQIGGLRKWRMAEATPGSRRNAVLADNGSRSPQRTIGSR